MLSELMHQLLAEAAGQGLESFFLHVAPNLGRDAQGQERIKPAAAGDVGTTDIQFMLTGSIKEAGLLVLLNQHIQRRWGESPLGETFNVRTAPTIPKRCWRWCSRASPRNGCRCWWVWETQSHPRHRLMARAG